MLKQLGLEFKLQKSSILTTLGVLFGGWTVGFIVLLIIMHTEPGESWVPLGTITATCIFLMLIVLLRAYSYRIDMLLALSMGRTRSEFMGLTFLRLLLENVLYFAILFGLYQLELHIYPLLFPDVPAEMDLDLPVLLRFLLPIFLASAVLPMFAGTLLARYGIKKAGIILYFLWLFSMIFLPKLFFATPADTSALDRMAFSLHQAVAQMPYGMVLTVTLGILALLGFYIWTDGKKVMVQ